MALLLRLLLITLLLVNTSASAWAATGMAASLLPAAGSAHSMAMASEAMTADCHGAPAAEAPMPCGNDSQHCDCLHACSALPSPVALWLPLALRASPQAPSPQPAAPPHLADPVRPPIHLPA